ncbi:MAG: hypothetical protein Q3M30_07525 [Candidatus Electrothrix sp. Rat3]|nr:hypothetical protein [Candidatus Electrothrix rattekaaiensis]
MYSEHLTFLSLILAAAIAENVSSIGTYIRYYRYIEFSYFIAGWVLLTSLAIIQFWYAISEAYTGENFEINFFVCLVDVITVTCYYLLSRLVFPDLSSYNLSDKIKHCCASCGEKDKKQVSMNEKYSLDNYYYRHSVTLCLIVMGLLLITIFRHKVFPYKDVADQTLFRAGFLVIVFIALATSYYERNYPDELQKEKDEFEREFTGVAYKYNLLMIGFFMCLFATYIYKFMM